MPDDIRGYLESLISSAVELNNVVPPAEASAAMEEEIKRRVPGLRAENLAETEVRTIDRKLTAKPTGFVGQTLLAIEEISRILSANDATAFEVRLANPVADPTWDFASIRLLVRYISD